MQLSNVSKYPAFIILGSIGTVILIIVSELIGFSHMNFVPLASPSYASWVYSVYFLISFLVFAKIFRLPNRSKYYIVAVFIVLTVWLYFAFEGNMFENPIPFGIDAV